MKRILSILFIVILLLTQPASKAAEPDTSAQSAVVMEIATNTMLFGVNPHEKLPMASTTKVMTALVALSVGNPDDIVTVTEQAYGVEGSSIYLELGEKISLRDLLYGLMLRSGNDAAVAIAIQIGGSVDAFVDMMNNTAKQIGATNTHFANPNGLPAEGHYTTAYDFALICAHAMKNAEFADIVSTKYHTTTTGKPRTMMNKNKLLWNYGGATGIKTGYTKAAGKCLTFSAERDGMGVVGVVLNCPNMFPDAEKLLDYAFSDYAMYGLVNAGEGIVLVDVKNAGGASVTLVALDTLNVPVKKADGVKVIPQIDVNTDITAPVEKGAKYGTLTLFVNGREMCKTALVAAESVYPATFSYYLSIMLAAWE